MGEFMTEEEGESFGRGFGGKIIDSFFWAKLKFLSGAESQVGIEEAESI